MLFNYNFCADNTIGLIGIIKICDGKQTNRKDQN